LSRKISKSRRARSPLPPFVAYEYQTDVTSPCSVRWSDFFQETASCDLDLKSTQKIQDVSNEKYEKKKLKAKTASLRSVTACRANLGALYFVKSLVTGIENTGKPMVCSSVAKKSKSLSE